MCTINGCPRIFTNANTWYKHIRNIHLDEYTRKGGSSYEESISVSSVEENVEELLSAEEDFLNPSELLIHPEQSSSIMREEVSGKLIKLKEKHRLSCAAVNEIVELVGLVCNDITSKSMSAIMDLGETSGMDMTSEFFTGLPEVVESIDYPLDMLKTNYKQQVYVAKNLPYVVRSSYQILDRIN